MIVLMHATMRERPPERCRSLSAAHQYDRGKHGLVYGFLHGEEQPAMAWVTSHRHASTTNCWNSSICPPACRRVGEAVQARTEDFSRHNPIQRWWGGTELTNDRLWRWDPANRALIAP